MAEAKTSVERLLSPVRELIESTAVMSTHLRDAIRVSNLFGEAFLCRADYFLWRPASGEKLDAVV